MRSRAACTSAGPLADTWILRVACGSARGQVGGVASGGASEAGKAEAVALTGPAGGPQSTAIVMS